MMTIDDMRDMLNDGDKKAAALEQAARNMQDGVHRWHAKRREILQMIASRANRNTSGRRKADTE